MQPLITLTALIGVAHAISWAMILDDTTTHRNHFTSLTYDIHVPPAPPPSVTSGPWFFWCGLQPRGGGVVQPVLQWGEAAPGYVNPKASFRHEWAMVLWDVPAGGKNNNQSKISKGVWSAKGDVIHSSVNYITGKWKQSTKVTAGKAKGQHTSTSINAGTYFHTDAAHDSNANFFVCESELDGSQTSKWNFNVTFTDIVLTAKTSDGLKELCGSQRSHSDGNGFAHIEGFSMPNAHTCKFSKLVLSPPKH